MQIPRIERLMGIEAYSTHSAGIGGTIRENAEDFIVEEMLVDGSKAQTEALNSHVERQVLGCSATKDRYLLCVMIKVNWDTLAAVKTIARQLGVASERVQIAGMKDAKALTAQHLTIEDASAEEVQRIRVKDIEVRPLGYVRTRLSSYYLLGNSFRVRVRAVSHSRKIIDNRITETIDALKDVGGVPNFFGHQRFGTVRPITHLVGKAIIEKDFKKAAMLFLAEPSPIEHPSSRRARLRLRATQNFEQALKTFPRQLRYERAMLVHLVKHPDDFVGVFRTLPSKLQRMLVQACESYLFNRFLSRRITLGLPLNMAEVGDYAVAVERSGLDVPKIYKTVSPENRAEINSAIKAGKIRLAIPLVGFKQRPSSGAQGEIEARILEEEDVSPRDFKIPSLPEMSARGTLRTATTPFNDFSAGESLPDVDRRGKHQVEVSFTLYRGSYATVVLRELMKPRNLIKQGF